MKKKSAYETDAAYEKRILTALGEIDDCYIEEAADLRPSCAKHDSPPDAAPPRKRLLLPAIAAAALPAAAVLFVCLHFLPARPDTTGTENPAVPTPVSDDPSDNSPSASDLPLLTSRFDTETGMGFESMMYYAIAEAENGNPWTEGQVLDTLPVYRNLSYTDMGGIPVFLSEEEMLALASQTADALATSVTSTACRRIGDVTDRPPAGRNSTDAYSLEAETPLGTISVYGNAQIRIFFSEPVTLPEEYRFTGSDTTNDEAGKVLRYLTRRYQALCAFDQPALCTGGDYTYNGERNRFYQAYDNSDDLAQRILNYHFNRISFSPDDDGNLFLIWFGNLLTGTEKIGDYPLISAQTARSLLLNGDYLTTVPQEYLQNNSIGEAQIAKTELVYRTGSTDELFLPYYRFYVELANAPSGMAEGLTCYGAYYVPAVSGEYLSDFPVWDGRFN